jgi:hypothetical protein
MSNEAGFLTDATGTPISSTTPLQVAGSLTVAGGQTPGDVVANPTDASDSRGFIEIYNGTTWDRLRESPSTAAATSGVTGFLGSSLLMMDGSNNLRIMQNAQALHLGQGAGGCHGRHRRDGDTCGRHLVACLGRAVGRLGFCSIAR